MSGLEVDLNFSVIDTKGNAITGFYASGELREASMVTTALTITRCSSVLYLVASQANMRRRPSSEPT